MKSRCVGGNAFVWFLYASTLFCYVGTEREGEEKKAERSLLFFHFRPTTFFSICPPTRTLHFLVFLTSTELIVFIVLSFLCSDENVFDKDRISTHASWAKENSSHEHWMTMTSNLPATCLVNAHKTIRERKEKENSIFCIENLFFLSPFSSSSRSSIFFSRFFPYVRY